jgi:hypothetical protein
MKSWVPFVSVIIMEAFARAAQEYEERKRLVREEFCFAGLFEKKFSKEFCKMV